MECLKVVDTHRPPGITAPLGSWTVPESVAVVTCAHVAVAMNSPSASTKLVIVNFLLIVSSLSAASREKVAG